MIRAFNFYFRKWREGDLPHEDALVISIVLTNHQVHRVLVDDESLVNILYKKKMSNTRIDPSRMTHVKKTI
jgi:hypothetical protein